MALYDRKILKLTWQTSNEGVKKVKLKNTTDVLHRMGDQWVRDAKKALVAGDKVASGRLKDSLGVKLKVKNDTIIQMAMMGQPYGPYVDQGVQGAGPFTPPKNPSGKSTKPYTNRAPDSPFKFGSKTGKGKIREGILGWLRTKRFQFRDDAGRFMSYEQMSYPISRNVYRYGIEPFPFIQKPWEAAWRRWNGKLAGAWKVDIRTYMASNEFPTKFKIKIEA